jgi:hypothetical protein
VTRWYDDTPPEQPRLCPLEHRVDPDRPRKSADSSILCRGHISQSRTALEELPGRYLELATIAAPTYEQRSGARSAEKPIPYRQHAADLRNGGKYDPDKPEITGVRLVGIRAALTNWVRIVAEERGLTLPEQQQRRTLGPACRCNGTHDSCRRIFAEIRSETLTEVDLAAEFLRRHHDWSVSQLWADDYATELRDLNEAAWSLLHPRRTEAATRLPCPADCGGTLRASFRDDDSHDDSLAPKVLICDGCSLPVPPEQWRKLARKIKHPDGHVTEEIVVLWAQANGWRLTEPTLRQWATRGKVTRHRVAGRTLYDLDEIEKLLRKDGSGERVA